MRAFDFSALSGAVTRLLGDGVASSLDRAVDREAEALRSPRTTRKGARMNAEVLFAADVLGNLARPAPLRSDSILACRPRYCETWALAELLRPHLTGWICEERGKGRRYVCAVCATDEDRRIPGLISEGVAPIPLFGPVRDLSAALGRPAVTCARCSGAAGEA